MAIVFAKQKKTQRNLIIVFTLILLITFVILWQGFFKEETLIFPGEVFLPLEKDIEINFAVFDHPKIRELVPFEEIAPFKETDPTEDRPGEAVGRENPFVPY